MPAYVQRNMGLQLTWGLLPVLGAVLLCGCPRPLDRLGAERDSIPGRNGGVAAMAQGESGSSSLAGAGEGMQADEALPPPHAGQGMPNVNPPRDDSSANGGDELPLEPALTYGPQPQQAGQSPASPVAPPGDPPGISDFIKSRQGVRDSAAAEVQKLPVSREAVLGDWNVYAMRLATESALMEPGERWIISLQMDGSAKVKQWLGEKEFIRSGTFTLSGELLDLALGPDGSESYSLELYTPDICLFRRLDGEGGLLYCAAAGKTAAVELKPRYDSDFGELQFTRSGPGFWLGSYGAPAGKLLLRQDGSIASGSWEQGGESGFAIFSFSADAFSGVWWKKDSAGVDGKWQGQAAAGGV